MTSARAQRIAEAAPPIPASCAGRPVVGGLVAPFVNVRLADGAVDFRSPHQATYERCWRDGLCQTCGNPYGRLAVLFGGPRQLASRRFDEPPLCLPCAVYASQACPMLAGRMPRYAARERISEGRRGHVCPDAGCDCGGFREADPDHYDSSGARFRRGRPAVRPPQDPKGKPMTAPTKPTAAVDESIELARRLEVYVTGDEPADLQEDS